MSVEERCEKSDLLKRPIILIGAGRSGSTLFVRMLNAHPDIQFVGETDFLIARVWREVWDNRFWVNSLNFQHHMLREPTSSREAPVEVPPELMDAAKERVSRGVRLLFAELLQLDAGFAAWGFKEIWNGNTAVARIPWNIYQTVFPHARWVHLVRHPFTFVQSSVRWDRLPLTTDRLTGQLKRWQQVVEWSQQLRDAPNFFEIRYEDLVSAPKATLVPILASVGLEWRNDCARELTRRVVASEQSFPAGRTKNLQFDTINKMIDNVPRLRLLMQAFRYEAPDRIQITSMAKAKSIFRKISKYKLSLSRARRLPDS